MCNQNISTFFELSHPEKWTFDGQKNIEIAEIRMAHLKDQLSENQRGLLDLIRKNQPVKRSDLAEQTKLTQQSAPGTAARPGKPSPELNLATDGRFGVGVLVNSNSIVTCITDHNCKPRSTQQFDFDVSTSDAALDFIETQIAITLVEENIPATAICGIGFTLPGFSASVKKMFNAPEPLKEWSLFDLQKERAGRLQLPISLKKTPVRWVKHVVQSAKNIAILSIWCLTTASVQRS